MVCRGPSFLGTLVLVLASATNGFAQNSHWGVGVSATPSWQIFPLLKVELMGAVIATPAVKIKVAGGLNFPGTGFRVLGVYLFGAK